MERKSILIAIGGGSGSGKTTLSDYLETIFKDDLVRVSYDTYCNDRSYLSPEERTKSNYDVPESYDAPLFSKHLKELLEGKSIQKPIYDFKTHSRIKETQLVEPKKIIIVEGIMIYQVPGIRDLLDLSIYVDTDADVRVLRRLSRDVKERGRTIESVIDQYLTTVKPCHYKYIEPTKDDCDIVFINNDNNGLDEIQIEKVMRRINELINR